MADAARTKGSRDALLNAALVRYRAGGHAAVSFRQLARDVGISHMQPYRFFRDKAELVAAMRCHCFRELLGVIRASDRVQERPLSRLYAITAGTFGYLFQRPEDYRLMFALNQPAPTGHEALAEARRAVYAYLRDVVQAGVDDGDLHGDVDDVLHLAWAVSHGLFTLHLSDQLMHGRDLESLVQPALDVMFAPFRNRPDIAALRASARHIPELRDDHDEESDDAPDHA